MVSCCGAASEVNNYIQDSDCLISRMENGVGLHLELLLLASILVKVHAVSTTLLVFDKLEVLSAQSKRLKY